MTPSDAHFDWSIEGVPARLAALWAGGASSAEVAATLSAEYGGKLTRNAVLGKVHRLGLTRDTQPPAPATVPLPKTVRVVAGVDIQADRPVFSQVIMVCESVEPPADGYRIEDVPLHGCKWPVSPHHVPAHHHRFCGARAKTGKSYCPAHYGVAYDAAHNAKIKEAGLRRSVS